MKTIQYEVIGERYLWNINNHDWARVYTLIHNTTRIPMSMIEISGNCGRRLVLRSAGNATEYRGCTRNKGISFTGWVDPDMKKGDYLNIKDNGMIVDCPCCISRIAETQYIIYKHNGGKPWEY